MICNIRTAQNDISGILDLIIEKLTKVLHVHPALLYIHYGYRTVQSHIQICRHITNCLHYIGKLSYTGGLNDHPLRLIPGNYLLKGLSEIAYQ